jgi:glycosyltransferase involved in cell wall biosynthesis
VEKQPLAVVTMTYNEKALLPVWLEHYKRQIGLEHCYVIDHGSDDGSTENIDASLIRLPRTPMDESARAQTVCDFCASLFIGYKRVLFTDADELVVPDPAISSNLGSYAADHNLPHVVTMFGVDVLHVAEESAIDFKAPISHQRCFARPLSALCKPTLIAGRTDWMHGFHCIVGNHRPNFADLFLFHIAHCDNGILYERQKKRNAATPTSIEASHHSIPPDKFIDHIQNEVASLPRRVIEMRRGEKHFEDTKRVFADQIEKKDWIAAPDIWRIPSRFSGTF